MFISCHFNLLDMPKDKEVYFLRCNQKARTASAQSFTLWQQAIIEITLLLHVHATCICVLLFVHVPFVVNRTFNATPTERLQQRPLLFAMKRTHRTFFLWWLHLAPPSHPGQSTTLLWLEYPGGKYAKLHTVAASNNRDLTSRSFYFCLFATHIYGCCFSRTSRSWRIAHSTLTERLHHLQQSWGRIFEMTESERDK